MLVPLADCLNHNNDTYIGPDLLDKNLHKTMQKSYLYRHNFDKTVKKHYTEDDYFDKSYSRININCAKLFSEDEIANGDIPAGISKHWQRSPSKTETTNTTAATSAPTSETSSFQKFVKNAKLSQAEINSEAQPEKT